MRLNESLASATPVRWTSSLVNDRVRHYLLYICAAAMVRLGEHEFELLFDYLSVGWDHRYPSVCVPVLRDKKRDSAATPAATVCVARGRWTALSRSRHRDSLSMHQAQSSIALHHWHVASSIGFSRSARRPSQVLCMCTKHVCDLGIAPLPSNTTAPALTTTP